MSAIKPIRSEAGVSLVAVLVALAITGVIAAVLVDMFTTNLKMLSGVQKGYEGETLNNEVRSLLGNHASCEESLKGRQVNQQVDRLMRVPSSGAPTIEFEVGKTYGADTVRIDRMRLLDRRDVYTVPGGTSSQITMEVLYSKMGQNLGAQNFSRSINLFAKINAAGEIENCVAKALMTDGIWRVRPNSSFAPGWDTYFSEGRVAVGLDQPTARLHVRRTAGAPEDAIRFENPGTPNFQTVAWAPDGNFFFGTQEFGANPLPASFETSIAPSLVVNGGTMTIRGSQMATDNRPMLLLQSEPSAGGGGAIYRFGRGGAFRLAAHPTFYNWAKPPFTKPNIFPSFADDFSVDVGGIQIGGGSMVVYGSVDAPVNAPLAQWVSPTSAGGAMYRFGRAGWFLMKGPAGGPRLHIQDQNYADTDVMHQTLIYADSISSPRITSQGPLTARDSMSVQKSLAVTENISAGGSITAAGQIMAATGMTTASDRRLKTDIKPVAGALDEILKLNGVRFKWQTDGREDMGVIAQDVKAVFPELVKPLPKFAKKDSGETFFGVSYQGLIAPIIEALREIKNWLTGHDVKIAKLEAENERLGQQVQSLSERLEALERAAKKD